MRPVSRTYLDYNATAPLLGCAREAMLGVMETHGNASSVHHEGRNARRIVEASREQVASLINANPANVVFTSGATEAVNQCLSPVMRAGGAEVPVAAVYAGRTEHPCVLSGGRFATEHVHGLEVDNQGLIDLEALDTALQQHDASKGLALVAVQLANNETGVIQPVRQVAEIVHEHNGLLLVDAVQGLGKLWFTLDELMADFVVLSGHKIGAPQGVGALVLANGNMAPVPLIRGGGQENHHRGGTENVAAIAGFGAACEWHRENMRKKINNSEIRDSIEAGLRTISHSAGNSVSQPVFFGAGTQRLSNTSCFSVPGVKAETALVALDLEGISISSGSACSSGKVKQSHVLEAMGAKDREMEGALRVSLGWEPEKEDAERFLEAWKTVIGRMAA